MHALQVAEVTSEQGFAALAGEWNAAVQASSVANVFLRHEWFSAAWAWRKRDSALSILTAADSSRVVALLPLIRPSRRAGSPRRIELLTVPDTQFADMVVDDVHATGAAEAFAAALSARRDWDMAHLDYLPLDSAVVRCLVPALRARGFAVSVADRGSNPCIDLAESWETYYSGRSRRLKKAVNLAANRLLKTGAIRIDWTGGATIDDVAFHRALEGLTEVSARSWKMQTGSTLDQEGPGAFIRTLSTLARDRGWLSIWLLYRDERPIASEYQLVYEGDVHALRADFAQHSEDISPGTHLFRKLLESLFGRGLERYYLGPGDNAYKRRWTDTSEPMQRVVVYSRTWRGRVERLKDQAVKPVLRSLRRSLGSPQATPRLADSSAAPDGAVKR